MKRKRDNFKKKRKIIAPEPAFTSKENNQIKEKWSLLSFIKKSFDFKTVLQILAIIISIAAISFTIYFNRKKDESEKSKISVQMGIQPTNQLDSSGGHRYYESWYIFMNTGNATTKTANIAWFLNNKYVEFHSKPYLIGPSHGAEINIIETYTPGFCEMNIKNLPPNVGFRIGVRHRVKNEFKDFLYQTWSKHMFDKDFTSCFLS